MKEKYNNKPSKKFDKDVERLKSGEPVDYVIGFTEFLGCNIDLSKKPLIPRPETEFWVGKEIKNVKKDSKVLDMFSGSGCIGISIMSRLQDNRGSSTKSGRHLNNIHVTFADNQQNAVNQIKINCKINEVLPKEYTVVKSDIFSDVKGTYDYIFANPPYIPTTRKNKIQKSVLAFEPKEALFGGVDGLSFIKIFLKDAKNFLNNDGKVLMEFDSIQKKSIEKLIKAYHYKKYTFHKDQYGRWRWVMIEL